MNTHVISELTSIHLCSFFLSFFLPVYIHTYFSGVEEASAGATYYDKEYSAVLPGRPGIAPSRSRQLNQNTLG